MKKGKAAGPDELPVEVWKCIGQMGVKFLTRRFNRLLMGERMSEEWRSVLNQSIKTKGFMSGMSIHAKKGTTDAMFALRMLMEKYREGQRELHCVFWI